MLLAAYDSSPYKIMLFVHIVLVVVGLGGVMWSGVYSMKGMKRGPIAANTVGHVVFEVNKLAGYFLYAAFVTGFGLVGMSGIGDDEKVFEMSDSWLSASMGLYIVVLGIVHSLIFPNVKRILAIGDELIAKGPQAGASGPPPEVAQIEALGKKVGMFSAIANVLGLAIVFLMVYKPGM